VSAPRRGAYRISPLTRSNFVNVTYRMPLRIERASRGWSVSENARGGRDDQGSNDEREDGGVKRRMKEEERADGGASDQRDKHTAQSAVLFAR